VRHGPSHRREEDVSIPPRPTEPPDDGIVYLESDGREDLSRALAEAARAVAAAEEKRRQGEAAAEAPLPVPEAGPAAHAASAVSAGAGFSELASRLADVEERLLAEQEESGRLREALLRKSADYDNLRRRAEKEKTDFFKFALSEVFSELLDVLDNFERALQHLSNGDEAAGTDVHVGIEMISRQLDEVLRKYGLEEVPALGLPFDPNVHEAVVREETVRAAAGTVLEVLLKGYVLNNRLLRPAKVKVAAAPPAGIGED
jgi:molecular chaperone GrpE